MSLGEKITEKLGGKMKKLRAKNHKGEVRDHRDCGHDSVNLT